MVYMNPQLAKRTFRRENRRQMRMLHQKDTAFPGEVFMLKTPNLAMSCDGTDTISRLGR